MTKTKEDIVDVVKKTFSEVPVAPMTDLAKQAFGDAVVTMDTVQLPRLLVINPTSKVKKQNKSFQDGDIVDSTNLDVIAENGKEVNVIPFALKFSIFRYIVENGEKEMLDVIPYTGPVPYETVIDGKNVQQVPAMTAYFLLTSDIEKGDALPYVYTFKGSSYQAGKKLNTIMFVKNKMAGRAPWASVISLFSIEKKNDKNEWSAMEVSQVKDRGANEKELAMAEFWYGEFTKGKVKVSEDDEEKVPF